MLCCAVTPWDALNISSTPWSQGEAYGIQAPGAHVMYMSMNDIITVLEGDVGCLVKKSNDESEAPNETLVSQYKSLVSYRNIMNLV